MDTAKCKHWLKPLFCFIAWAYASPDLAASKHDNRFTRMHYGLAQGTYEIGDYTGALESLSILLQQHPAHIAALQLKAQAEWQLGRHQEAEQTLEEAARIQPDNETTQLLRKALVRQGKIQAVFEHARQLTKQARFEQALSELEKYPDWLYFDPRLAELYLNISLRQENWTTLEPFLRSLPNHLLEADYRAYLQGRIKLASGDLAAAKSHFANALQNAPTPSLHSSLLFYQAHCAETHNQIKLHAEIVQALDAGFRPETLSEFEIACTSLLRQNAPKRALQLLESALHQPVAENALFWLTLSRVQLANRQPERAISASTQAISLQADLAQAYILRAQAHARRRDFAQAKDDYRQALALQPERLDIHYALAINCLYASEIQSAYSALQRASQTKQASNFWLIFAVLAHANGQPQEAQSALTQYKNLQMQDRSLSADYLGILLNQSDDHARDPLTVSSPERHDFQLFHRGQLSGEALVERRLHSQSSSTFDAQQKCALFYWMAQSYQTRSQTGKAVRYFKKALENGKPDWIEWHLANWQLQQKAYRASP